MSRHRPDRPRVLAIHRYYWPDSPPYASMLRAIAARWARDGSNVRIVSSQPSYKPEAAIPRRPWRETLDGVGVERLRLLPETGSRFPKLLNLPLFVLAASWRVLRLQRDVVMCSTAPPVVLASVVSLAARLKGAQFIYHCMDIHPEIGALSGEFANPLVYRLLRRIDRATCRRSAAIVVLSADMREALLERDPDLASRIVVLNNFALPEYSQAFESDDVPSGPPPTSAHRRMVFTGNVGRYQGLDDVVTAVLESDADVELVIMGEGQAKAGLQSLASGYPPEKARRVIFLPYGTPAQARALMQTASIGVVSLVPDIVRYAYPSKTMTYLSEGLPLLLVAEEDTEIARTVRHEGIGFTVAPGDRVGIKRVIQAISENGSQLGAMREGASRAAEAWFDTETLLRRWDSLLHRVRNGSNAGT